MAEDGHVLGKDLQHQGNGRKGSLLGKTIVLVSLGLEESNHDEFCIVLGQVKDLSIHYIEMPCIYVSGRNTQSILYKIISHPTYVYKYPAACHLAIFSTLVILLWKKIDNWLLTTVKHPYMSWYMHYWTAICF